jgi:hypothetical protein
LLIRLSLNEHAKPAIYRSRHRARANISAKVGRGYIAEILFKLSNRRKVLLEVAWDF